MIFPSRCGNLWKRPSPPPRRSIGCWKNWPDFTQNACWRKQLVLLRASFVLPLSTGMRFFIKLLAQKLTAGQTEVVALLASGAGQPTLCFAQSPGQKFNMGQLMKEAMAELGGRGGGSADLAQGGLPAGEGLENVEKVLYRTAENLQTGQRPSA